MIIPRNFLMMVNCRLYHPEQKFTFANLDLGHIEKNIFMRHHYNNVPVIRQLINKLQANFVAEDERQLKKELLKLPNETHSRLWHYGTEPKSTILDKFSQTVKRSGFDFSEICKYNKMLRMENLSNYTGHKSYYLFGKLAELEHALIEYTLSILKKHQFKLMAVPDILPKEIIEACGMHTDGNRSQVYALDSQNCLSGTAEMSLAGYFSNKTFSEESLPVKVAAVSRCFRAETSGLQEEKGIYRVHQFTKVEMFAVCQENQSHEMLNYFKDIEIEIFKNFNLQLRLLDMPPSELGAPAFEKYDIEAWMPGRGMWGEISSCSNCTQYQAKRLNLKYITRKGDITDAHTVNGTAAAIPRLLIAIIESNQVGNDVLIPTVLMNYLNAEKLTKETTVPDLKLIKHIKAFS